MGSEAKKIPEERKKEVTTSEAREKFADLIERVCFEKERIVVVRRGKKAVALIPFEDLELLEAFEEEEDLEDIKAMEAAKIEQGDDPLIPWEQVKAKAGLK
jgi:prevent-host-death family protein